jgi:thiol-disulfide isomerase/thioredoxin
MDDPLENTSSDLIRIRDKIAAARELVDIASQSHDDQSAVRGAICREFRTLKERDHLTNDIDNLEFENKQLHNYIRMLEFVNVNIWCPKCESFGQIGDRIEGDITLSMAEKRINVLTVENEMYARKMEEYEDIIAELKETTDKTTETSFKVVAPTLHILQAKQNKIEADFIYQSAKLKAQLGCFTNGDLCQEVTQKTRTDIITMDEHSRLVDYFKDVKIESSNSLIDDIIIEDISADNLL